MKQGKYKTSRILTIERKPAGRAEIPSITAPVRQHDALGQASGPSGIHQDSHVLFFGVLFRFIGIGTLEEVFIELIACDRIIQRDPVPDIGEIRFYLHNPVFIAIGSEEAGGLRIIDNLDQFFIRQSEIKGRNTNPDLAGRKINFKIFVGIFAQDG